VRGQFAWAASLLKRVTILVMLALLVLGAYTTTYTILTERVQLDIAPALLGAAISVVLSLFVPVLREQIVYFTNWVWYGAAIGYQPVVTRITTALASTLDQTTLHRILTTDLPTALALDRSVLLLRTDDTLALLEHVPARSNAIPIDGPLSAVLASAGTPLSINEIRRHIAGVSLLPEEAALLERADVARWLPLVAHGELQGVLLISGRDGEDDLTPSDMHILATVGRQAAIATHNVRLVESVARGRQELAYAHREALEGREREQRRLAHELHDDSIQSLLALSYRLAAMRTTTTDAALGESLVTVRRETLGVVQGLRHMIGQLRPPGLDDLGLTAALEGEVGRLQRLHGTQKPRVVSDFDQVGPHCPEAVATCVFRAVQEGLRNAIKHAGATTVWVVLRAEADGILVSICDNGAGFQLPARLSTFAQAEHFGLLGITERVAWTGGTWEIETAPGRGTTLTIQVPIGTANEVRL